MSTAFKPLEIPPGVVAKATKKMMSSNWAEVNCVRWVEGQLTPIGGQTQYGYSFATRCKAVHGWYGIDGIYRLAYLCEGNLYVDVGGTLFDISPSVPIAPVVPATVGGYGDLAYNIGPPDSYNTPRAEGFLFALDKVPDAFSLDNFGSILYAMSSVDGRLLMWDPGQGSPGVVATLNAASAIVTTSPNITMPANPGTVTAGMSVFNTTTNQPVGTVLTYSGTALVLTANALNAGAIGNHLAFGNVAVTQPATSGRGVVPNGRFFVVTPERFILIFGSYNDGTTGSPTTAGRRFAWCDQENPSAWDYTNVVSQAGFLDIEPAAPIICGSSSRTGTIFFTGKKAYRSRFLGVPFVYNYEELADNCTPWSPQSMATTSSMIIWMSQQGVFSFDGTSILPVQCMVRPGVDDNIDILNVREQACAVHLSTFNEWWWFYPEEGQPYNTRAIFYSYKEGWWSEAEMSRSAGITANYNSQSIFADGLIAMQHETFDAYVNAAPPFVETFDLNIAGGGRLVTVKQLLPDIEIVGEQDPVAEADAIQQLRYSLFYRNSRTIGDLEQQTPFAFVRPNGYVDFRTTGRDIRMRIDLPVGLIPNFTIGQHQIDIVVRGDR